MKNWYKILSFFRTVFGLYKGKGLEIDKSKWILTFYDHFENPYLNKMKWRTNFHTGKTDPNQNMQWYDNKQISFISSVCNLVVCKSHTGKDERLFRSSMINTGPLSKWSGPRTFEQKYGYFEIGCKVPKGAGLWPAFWLYDGLPEIDIMEIGGSKTNRLRVAYHYGKSYKGGELISQGNKLYIPDASKRYHTYGVDWEPNKLTYYFDGYPVWVVKGDFVCKKKRYMIINLAVSYPGIFGETVNKDTSFPSYFNIDYVKVYKRI